MELFNPQDSAELWQADAVFQVLNSRLEKTRILNSKLTASLQRLKDSGRSVQDAIGPLAGNTNTLRTTQNSTATPINASAFSDC